MMDNFIKWMNKVKECDDVFEIVVEQLYSNTEDDLKLIKQMNDISNQNIEISTD